MYSAVGRKKSLLSACVSIIEDLEGRRLLSTLPFNLNFSTSQGGILDANGLGTGFTSVQANKNGNQYQANLINLDTKDGLLKITTTGTSTSGTNSGSDNTQVDALQTSFNGTTGAFTIQTRLIGPLSYLASSYDQGGIYFGPDQDNYVKLVAIDNGGSQVLQFKDELGGSTTSQLPTSVQGVNIGSFSGISTLDLRLVGDPSSGKVTASYAINGGSFVTLSTALTLTGTNETNFFNAASEAGVIQAQKNNLAPIVVTYDGFSITAGGTVSTSHPSVTDIRPENGATGVTRDAFVAAALHLPNSGVDSTTLQGNVLLFNTATNAPVAGVVNTSGGGDDIVFTPENLLDANTNYTFEVTAGVKDTTGATFTPYKSSFTTGTAGGNDGTMSFEKDVQSVSVGDTYTSVTVGPDHNLYATTIDGLILRFTINADGSLSAPQTITTIQSHNGGKEAVTSLAFDPSSTASNLIAYVSESAPSLTNAPDWSGKIAKLSGANLQNYQELIVGLPRSNQDHMTNQIVFGPDGMMYFAQASNNAMGAPDSTWGNRPDHLLNDAILQLNLSLLPATLPLNVQTDSIANPYNPYAANAPLKIYADGVRNAYDLVFASNGHLYAPVNGSSAGGNTPASPNGSVPALTDLALTEHDFLDDIVPGKYYGHPNPTRGEYVMDGGNPTAGVDPFEVPEYPVGTQPGPNYDPPVFDFGQNYSPDGIIQYSGNAFGGELNGKLMVVRYSGGADIEVLTPNADGSISPNAETDISGANGFNGAVDLTEDKSTGFIYVAEYGAGQIDLLKPQTTGGSVSPSASTMYLNDVKTGSTDPGGTAKSEVLTITNSGTGSLDFASGAFTISGTNASNFTITSGNLPTTLEPGQSVNITVNFTATAIGTATATLTIKSDSPNNPLVTVNLRGLGMAGTEIANGLNEPSLQALLNFFQIPDNVGEPNPSQTAFPVPPSTPNDEVTMQELVKAGDGDVSIQLLSVFDNLKSPATDLGYYQPGTPDVETQLFSVPESGAQSVDPSINGTTTFNPGSSAFDMYAVFPAFTNRQSYEEDALNTWDTVNPRKMRFYPLKNADGSIVPNAYVFAFEDYNKAYDFNDVVGIIRNVQAAPTGAYIGTANLDGGLYNHLTMSRIQNLDTRVPNVTHGVGSLEIRNTGSQPLTISSMVLSGPFSFVSGGNTTTIAAGGNATVKVQFTGSTSSLVSVINGTLTINSNAVNQPTTTIALSGIYQEYSEQSPNNVYSEPSLQQIVNAFGYTTVVANPNQETVDGDYVELGQEGQGVAVGQETLSGYWEQADSNAPVTVQMLAAFHKESAQDTLGNLENTNSTIKYYYQGTPTSTTTLFSHNQDEGQTILPHLNGSTTNYAVASFTPSSGKAFGFKVDSNYSDDSLNKLDWNHSDPSETPIPGTGHSIRFYALRDENGNVIPNTYLMAMDYTGISYSNYDYQDNIYIVKNVKPVSPPAPPKNVTASAGGAGVTLSWTANSEGNVAGYRVYRSSSATGTFTLLNTTLLTSPSYTDVTAPAGTSFYRVTAVDLNGNESNYTSTSGTSTGGGTTTLNAPSNLQVTASSNTEIDLSWTDNSTNETGFEVMRATSATGTFSTVFTTSANAITFQDQNVTAGQTYFYEIVATNGSTQSTASNEVSATATTQQQQQGVLTSTDIGGVSPAGTTDTITDGSDYDITAGGVNIWGTSDQFRFAYEQVTGDFDVKVQVLNIEGTDPKAKAGIMARDSLSASAANAFARINPTAANGPRLSYRTTDGGTSNTAGSGDGTDPIWVRLQRVGNVFTAYQSADGVTWTVIGSTTISMPSTVFLGLATASDVAGQSATAQYRSFGNTNAVVPTAPAAPSNLVATATSPTQVSLNWTDNSTNETGFKVMRATSVSGPFTTIFTTAAGATSYVDATALANTTCFYQIVATNSVGDSTPSNQMQVTTPQPVQSTVLTSDDIGGVSPAGTTDTITDGSDYDITAGGVNIWGTSDQFRFVYEQVTGNFDVKVQVLSINGTDPKAKAGIMARDSLNANAANAYARVNPLATNGPRLSYRTTDGGSSFTSGTGDGTDPIWVRLQRVGNVFTAYQSPDGTTWTLIGSTTIAMPSTVFLGLATASNVAGQTATAQYRGFSNTSAPIVTVPAAATNLSATASSPTEVDLNWTDNSTNETGFKVMRATSASGPFTTIFTTAPGATSFSDMTAVASTTYFYEIVATNSAGDSTPSNVFQIATPAPAPTQTFTNEDIGNPTPAGSSTQVSSTQFNVTGGGSDVWNSSDQFQFEATQLTGNFDVSVEINSATFNASVNPLVGLMARNTLDANSANVYMRTVGQPGGAYKLGSRATAGGTSVSTGSGVNNIGTGESWVRLTRVGNVFTGYYSTDGVNWTMVSSVTVNMSQTIYVGMAVSSRSTTTTATAQFSNLTIE